MTSAREVVVLRFAAREGSKQSEATHDVGQNKKGAAIGRPFFVSTKLI
jgi:hypothetical protein